MRSRRSGCPLISQDFVTWAPLYWPGVSHICVVSVFNTPHSKHFILDFSFYFLCNSGIGCNIICPLMCNKKTLVINHRTWFQLLAGWQRGWAGAAEEVDHLPESPASVFPPRRWFPLQHHPGHVCPEAHRRQLGEHRLLRSLHLPVVRQQCNDPGTQQHIFTWKQILQNWVCIDWMFRLNYCNAGKMERTMRVDGQILIDGERATLSCEILA